MDNNFKALPTTIKAWDFLIISMHMQICVSAAPSSVPCKHLPWQGKSPPPPPIFAFHSNFTNANEDNEYYKENNCLKPVVPARNNVRYIKANYNGYINN